LDDTYVEADTELKVTDLISEISAN